MKRKKELIEEIVRLSKQQPEFQNGFADIVEYRAFLERKEDLEDLEIILHNKRAFTSPAFAHSVEREIQRLDKAGMFNVGSLSPEHALD